MSKNMQSLYLFNFIPYEKDMVPMAQGRHVRGLERLCYFHKNSDKREHKREKERPYNELKY